MTILTGEPLAKLREAALRYAKAKERFVAADRAALTAEERADALVLEVEMEVAKEHYTMQAGAIRNAALRQSST